MTLLFPLLQKLNKHFKTGRPVLQFDQALLQFIGKWPHQILKVGYFASQIGHMATKQLKSSSRRCQCAPIVALSLPQSEGQSKFVKASNVGNITVERIRYGYINKLHCGLCHARLNPGNSLCA
jgi:hypothetical protein